MGKLEALRGEDPAGELSGEIRTHPALVRLDVNDTEQPLNERHCLLESKEVLDEASFEPMGENEAIGSHLRAETTLEIFARSQIAVEQPTRAQHPSHLFYRSSRILHRDVVEDTVGDRDVESPVAERQPGDITDPQVTGQSLAPTPVAGPLDRSLRNVDARYAEPLLGEKCDVTPVPTTEI